MTSPTDSAETPPPDGPMPSTTASPAAGSTWVNLGLLALTLVLLLGIFELTLRLSGFSFVLYPEDIEFGRPDPVMLKVGFLEDDELFWVTRDYPEKLERLRQERPPLLLLGDSCTHLGRWDEALAALGEEHFDRPLAWGNLAVAGWSSYQGLRQLERDGLALEPRVVTIFYGWNDHWIGFGLEDRTVAQVKRIFSSRWSGLRLVQLATKATVVWRARENGWPNRVSLEDFADNLRQMVALARSSGSGKGSGSGSGSGNGNGGAVPVLFTAPSNHRIGEEPPELTERWLREADQLVPLHQSYVQAVRQVAAETGAPLCDLEARFAALSQEERDRLFSSDGIHFTPAGDRRIAQEVFDCFEAAGLWPLLVDTGSPDAH